MNRDEFMKELEYLLQDIPDEEKMDAIAYYQDYLDEAGDEAERVIKEFGSPERIAAIIRTDIAGNIEQGGEFTERGYEDERFKDPNYQVAKRFDLPEIKADEDTSGQSQYRDGSYMKHQPRTNRPLKIILVIILLLISSPIWLGLGGGLLGVAVGVFAAFIALMISVAVITVVFFIVGIVCGVVGIIYMITNPLGGLLSIGIGCLLVGLAFLGLIITAQIFGRFIPWMIRGVVDCISGLFRRGGQVR